MILKLVSDAGGGASASTTENAALREQVRLPFIFTLFLLSLKEHSAVCFTHFTLQKPQLLLFFLLLVYLLNFNWMFLCRLFTYEGLHQCFCLREESLDLWPLIPEFWGPEPLSSWTQPSCVTTTLSLLRRVTLSCRGKCRADFLNHTEMTSYLEDVVVFVCEGRGTESDRDWWLKFISWSINKDKKNERERRKEKE